MRFDTLTLSTRMRFSVHSTSPALIEADTKALIARFGERACLEARLRSHGEPCKGARRSRHLGAKVKDTIRRMRESLE